MRYSRYLGIIFVVALSIGPVDGQQLTMQDFERAERLFESGQYEESRKIHEFIAADHAYEPSQFRLGWIYQRGLGVPVDCMSAARWYTFSANQGNSASAFNLYGIYGYGCENLPKDEGNSRRWLKKAADLGNPVAMAELALALAEGVMFERSPFEAYDYAARAATTGDGYGIAVKAALVVYGVGTEANPVQGLGELEKAFFVESLYTGHRLYVAQSLSEMYQKGIGAAASVRQSLKWALVAEKLGSLNTEQVTELKSNLDARNLEMVQGEVNRLLRDKAGTSVSMDDVFRRALESTSGKEKASLVAILRDAQDIRGELIAGLMEYDGEGEAERDVDEALVKFKRVCREFPGGMGCVAQANALASQGRKEEARSVLNAFEQPSFVELGQSGIFMNEGVVSLYVELGMKDTVQKIIEKIESSNPSYGEIEKLKAALVEPRPSN